MKEGLLFASGAHVARVAYKAYGPYGFLLLLCALLLGACTRPALYEYAVVNPHGWLTTDTIRFTLLQVPRDGDYTLSLGVRYNHLVPYADLWLVVEQRYVGEGDAPVTRVGEECRCRDTLHLAMPVAVNLWQSNGSVFHVSEAPAVTAHFTARQMPVKLLVYHVMNHQCLTGIMEVGVKVE